MWPWQSTSRKKICNSVQIPSDWKQGIVIKLPKKGDLTECRNWRGITILNIIGKILATIVYNRLKEELEAKMRPEQAGFRSNKACADHINIFRIIVEQSIEFRSPLQLVYRFPTGLSHPGTGCNLVGTEGKRWTTKNNLYYTGYLWAIIMQYSTQESDTRTVTGVEWSKTAKMAAESVFSHECASTVSVHNKGNNGVNICYKCAE